MSAGTGAASLRYPAGAPPGIHIAAGSQYFSLWLANEANVGNSCGIVIQRFVYDAGNALVFSDNFLVYSGACIVGQWFFIPVVTWNDGTHTIFINVAGSGGGFQQNWFDALLQDDQGAQVLGTPGGTLAGCDACSLLNQILASVQRVY